MVKLKIFSSASDVAYTCCFMLTIFFKPPNWDILILPQNPDVCPYDSLFKLVVTGACLTDWRRLQQCYFQPVLPLLMFAHKHRFCVSAFPLWVTESGHLRCVQKAAQSIHCLVLFFGGSCKPPGALWRTLTFFPGMTTSLPDVAQQVPSGRD